MKAANETLGPFQLLRVLASDPGGVLYEALDAPHAQRVALRVMPARPVPRSADEATRLRALALAATDLQHPNLVPFLECGWHGRSAFVATALVEGESLSQYRARVGRLPAFQALALAAQLLSALAALHARGLVHGAIEPGQLLITRCGQLKLAGLGWAAADPGSGAPASPYRAPEQAIGAPFDHRADLYAAGVLAYELLTGSLPFAAERHAESGSRAGNRLPRAVHARRPELPGALDAVFRRSLSVEPEARYADASAFLLDLQAAMGQPVWERPAMPDSIGARAGGQAASPPAPRVRPTVAGLAASPARPGPARSRKRRLLATTAAAVAVLVASALNFIAGPPQQATELAGGVAAIGVAVEGPVLDRRAQRAAMTRPALPPAPAAAPARELAAAGQPDAFRPPDPGAASERVAASAPADLRPARKQPIKKVVQARRTAGGPPGTPRWPDLNCRGDGLGRELCVGLRCASAEFGRHPVCTRLAADRRAREQLARSYGAP